MSGDDPACTWLRGSSNPPARTRFPGLETCDRPGLPVSSPLPFDRSGTSSAGSFSGTSKRVWCATVPGVDRLLQRHAVRYMRKRTGRPAGTPLVGSLAEVWRLSLQSLCQAFRPTPPITYPVPPSPSRLRRPASARARSGTGHARVTGLRLCHTLRAPLPPLVRPPTGRARSRKTRQGRDIMGQPQPYGQPQYPQQPGRQPQQPYPGQPYGQQPYPPQGGPQPGWQPPYPGQPWPQQQGWPPPGPRDSRRGRRVEVATWSGTSSRASAPSS